MSFFDFFNPEFYINYGGIWLLLFIVFAETGLMLGFFLPGDSLIFIAGIYSSSLIGNIISGGTGNDFFDLLILIVLLCICGISGNMVGYWFGEKSGTYLFDKDDSWIFKKKYLVQAQKFYDEYGAQTIIFARFLPTVRTFVPIIAGVVNMNKIKFMSYNITGCVLWIVSVSMTGHYLDKFLLNRYNISIKSHLEVIVIGLIIITTIPFIWKYFSLRNKKR
ncbi:MAG: VTT domain-containing protein [Dysgonamonadaceae bacterium]|jgi:membrane-associated protein|nr:VTT domain-containing protein [Dysgonamonadaceae bacterium]